MFGLEGLVLTTHLHFCGEDKDNPKDGEKWYVTAGGFVFATITCQKYIRFTKYEVTFTVIGIDGKAQENPFKSKNTLEDALNSVHARLKKD